MFLFIFIWQSTSEYLSANVFNLASTTTTKPYPPLFTGVSYSYMNTIATFGLLKLNFFSETTNTRVLFNDITQVSLGLPLLPLALPYAIRSSLFLTTALVGLCMTCPTIVGGFLLSKVTYELLTLISRVCSFHNLSFLVFPHPYKSVAPVTFFWTCCFLVAQHFVTYRNVGLMAVS